MKNDPVQTALAALDEIPVQTPEGRKRIARALASKSNLVVAKAARIAGGALWREVSGDLVAAFDRLLPRGAELDKGCVALTAIARALFALDYDGATLYLEGMRHVQREPVWGGSTDTAVDLRVVCAMGLANTTYNDKLRALIVLLVDGEWQVRSGAARAIAAIGSPPAMLLLRFKALTGDKEPDVLAECYSGLLAVEGGEAIPLVTSFAASRDREVREAAILALGASRRADAVDWLTARFETAADPETRHCLLLSLATSRTEAAVAFLLGVIRGGSAQSSAMAASAMEINMADARIREEVERALGARSAR